MPSLRRAAAPFACVLAGVLVLEACASGRLAEERAILEAGREIRLRESGHTQADVKKEIDLFLNIELPALKDKAKRAEDHELTVYKWIWAIGGAGALALGTSGSLNDPKNRGTQYALTAVSLAVALIGFALYSVRTSQVEDCRAFLDEGGGDLAEWGRRKLLPSDDSVSPELWDTYVRKIHGIRAHPTCLKLRR